MNTERRAINQKALLYVLEQYKRGAWTFDDIWEELEPIAEAEAQAQTEKKDWIAVEAALPDIDEWVLVTDKGCGVGEAYLGKNGLFNVYGRIDMKESVIAWMPLPEAYKNGV